METKVPLYSIVNIFLPGLILVGSCVLLFLDEIKTLAKAVTDLGNSGLEVLITVSVFAIACEAGYIVFRLGALIIQPILKMMFGWVKYKNFIAAGKTSEKAYEKLEMHSREYGYARTQITLFILLAALTGIREHWWLVICCVLSVLLFLLSARGHMKGIQTAVFEYLVAMSGEGETAGNA